MSKLDWETIHSKYLLKHRWMSLRQDRCQMPDGRIVDPYFVLEFSDWVNIFALTDNKEVVTVRQYRHGLGKTFLELPSGFMDEGEQPLKSARRELLEETGYISDKFIETAKISANPANHNNITYCYLALNAKKNAEQSLDKYEDIEIVLTPLDKLIEMVSDGEIINALYISAIFFALKKLEKFSL